jgi:hypothetical protein
MKHTPTTAQYCSILIAAALLAACNDPSPVEPPRSVQMAKQAAAENQALATLRRVTARYHELDAAVADGFILLHDCEVRPGEGAVGILYVHLGRYLDGIVDPTSPDGLLYAPGPNGKPMLAGVELALPQAMWTASEPPEFLGTSFQAEDEFAAFGLHVWVWRHNPNGMFAQAHPGIACEAES